MSRQYQALLACIALAFALFLLADQASAQSFFSNNDYQRRQAMGLASTKVILATLIIGLGFGVGWIISPHGRALRRIGLLILIGLVGLIAVLNSGYRG